MRVEVIMPQMGESIVEGTVVSWIKQVGDPVKRDEDIFTISTDKVDADIPSPAEGLLEAILVKVGDTVEVGTVVAFIETDAKAAEREAPRPSRSSTATPPPSDAAPRTSAPVPKEPAAGEARGARGGNGAGGPPVEELRRTRSTPLVRKIAREHGIQDLSIVPGSGVSGRVTKTDILEFVARADRMAAEAPARGEPFELPIGRRRSERPIAGPQEGPAPSPDGRDETPAAATPSILADAPPVHVFEEDRVEPMTRMRKSIAEHMVMSKRVSPHVQTVWECDWTKAARARQTLKVEYERRGVNLTYTAFMVAAAVQALRAHPVVNASIDGDRIVYRGSIHVGVAVALADGLIVPVIKRADELSLLGIARAVNDVSSRARDNRLKPEDVERGTFTITNPGVFGSLFGVPIISQPQVAILGVGAIKKSLVVGDDDSIRIAPISLMCLSFDHRIVDGATADRFMQTFVGFIENYEVPEGAGL